MTKALQHVRTNAIAYLALFVALGGAGYAAVNLPPRSVGTKQLKTGAVTTRVLKNGAVTARKVDGKTIAASVRAWAVVTAEGRLAAGSRGAHVVSWAPGAGTIGFPGSIPLGCFSLATSTAVPPGMVSSYLAGGNASVAMLDSAGHRTTEGVTVAALCPGR